VKPKEKGGDIKVEEIKKEIFWGKQRKHGRYIFGKQKIRR
jgi:hypothetical protein